MVLGSGSKPPSESSRTDGGGGGGALSLSRMEEKWMSMIYWGWDQTPVSTSFWNNDVLGVIGVSTVGSGDVVSVVDDSSDRATS